MAENVANSINDLHGPMLGILTIDQVCSECSSGVHPPIPSGLSGILNSFGWLTAASSDEPAVRQAMVAALPAFAHLVWVAISSTPALYREWGTHHVQLRELTDKLDPWLPLGGRFSELF